MQLLAQHGQWALVQQPEMGTDSNSEPATSALAASVGVVPTACLAQRVANSTSASAFDAPPPRASQPIVETPPPSGISAKSEAALNLKMERVSRTWRSNLKRSLASSDRDAYDRIGNQVSQLSEWRRQKVSIESSNASDSVTGSSGGAVSSSTKVVAAVNESILNLVESTSQQREGLVTPRTDTDEPASEENTGVLHLLRMHMDTEKRMQGGTKVPTTASEALSAGVAKGLHGGPSVPNERATDVSGLWASAAPDTESLPKPSTPLQAVADGLAFQSRSEPASGLVQLLVEVQTAASLMEMGQPGEVHVSVWDALNSQSITQHVAITFDSRGRPMHIKGPNGPIGATGSSNSSSKIISSGSGDWSQAFFVNVPRQLVCMGKCYLVFRVFRRGPLKENAISKESASGQLLVHAANGEHTSKDGYRELDSSKAAAIAASKPGGTNSFTSMLRGRKTKATAAIYLRPVGVGIMAIPNVLPRLADGTPHRSADPLFFMRPAKAEESRFFGLHKLMIVERERDQEAEGRRRGHVGASSSSSAGASSASALDHAHSSRDNNGVTGSDPSTARSSGEAAAASSSSTASGQLVRAPKLGAMPVVVRCFSSLLLQTLTDARYLHLFSGPLREGIHSLAQPMLWSWMSSAATQHHQDHPFSGAGKFDAQARGPMSPDRSARVATALGRLDSISEEHGDRFGPVSTASTSLDPLHRAVELVSPAITGIDIVPPLQPAVPGGDDALMRRLQMVHRDVLYVTLRRGIFAQDKKISPRNVQVRIRCVLHNGDSLPCLLRAVPGGLRSDTMDVAPNHSAATTGSSAYVDQHLNVSDADVRAGSFSGSVASSMAPSTHTAHTNSAALHSSPSSSAAATGLSEYRSAVYYHCNSPVFDETLAVFLPSNAQFELSHLLLTFWHASSSEAKSHMFAFAFLPLADVTGTALRDGKHVLRCYKPTTTMLRPAAPAGQPWYLVSPVVDQSGLEIIPPAPVPFTHQHSELGSEGESASDNLNANGSHEQLATGPVLTAAHARSACNRHLPVTAMALHVGETAPTTNAAANSHTIGSSTHTSPGMSKLRQNSTGAPSTQSGVRSSATTSGSGVSASFVSGSSSGLSAASIAGGGIGGGAQSQWASAAAKSGGVSNGFGGRGQRAGGMLGFGTVKQPSTLSPSASSAAAPVAMPAKAPARPPPKPSASSSAAAAATAESIHASEGSLSTPADGATAEWGTHAKEAGAAATAHAPAHSNFKHWSSPSAPRNRSASIVSALGLDAVAGAMGMVDHHSAQGSDPMSLEAVLEPLLIRRDTIEVETKLISDSKSNIPELHTLQRWKSVSRATLLSALGQLGKLPASQPELLVRVLPKMLTSLCEIIASFSPDGKLAAPSASATADTHGLSARDSHADTTLRSISARGSMSSEFSGATNAVEVAAAQAAAALSGAGHTAASHTHTNDKLSGKLLSTAVTLLVQVMDSLFATVRIAPQSFSNQNAADGGKGDRRSRFDTLMPVDDDPASEQDLARGRRACMWPPHPSSHLPLMDAGLDSYAAAHALESYFRSSFYSPRLHSVLLHALTAMIKSAARADGQSGESDTASMPARDGTSASQLSITVANHTILCAARCCDSLLRLCTESFQQHLNAEHDSTAACAIHDAARSQSLSFLAACVALQGSPGSTPRRPAWAVAAQCAVLQVLPRLVAHMDGVLPPVESAQVLASSIRSASACDAASVRLSALLSCRSIVTKQLLSQPDMYRTLLPVIVSTLSSQLSESGAQRAIGMRIITALLHSRETSAPRPSKTIGDIISTDAWCMSLLLAEASTAVQGVVLGIAAPGDIFAATGVYRTQESASLSKALRSAGKHHLLPVLDASSRFKSSFSNHHSVQSVALPSSVYEEVYGPLISGSSSATSHLMSDAASNEAANNTFFKLAEAEASRATQMAAFLDRSCRVAVNAWMSLVWSIPDAAGAVLLASVAPMHHLASPTANSLPMAMVMDLLTDVGSSGPASAADTSEVRRLQLALQLSNTCLLLLSRSVQPASWLVLNMLLHSCALKVYRWTAALLAACYRGSQADDAAFAAATATTSRPGPAVIHAAAAQCSWAVAKPLWSSFLQLTIALLTSPLFAPESLRPSRRQAVSERYGDRRGEVCKIFRQLWTLRRGVQAGPSAAAGPMTGPRSKGRAGQQPGADLLRIPSREFYLSGGQSAPFMTATASAVSSGLCASLRICLAPQIVAPLLDLTHCVNNEVASLARDIYLDLIQAELTLQGLRAAHYSASSAAVGQFTASVGSPVGIASTAGAANLAMLSARSGIDSSSAAAEMSFAGLPEIERLTIDAIDVLVAQKGPSLVIPKDRVSGPTSTGAAGGAGAMHAMLAQGGGGTVTPKQRPLKMAGRAQGVSTRSAVADIFASTFSAGTVPSNSSSSSKREGGGVGLYVPPSDNLIMSLFAPKRLQRTLTSSSLMANSVTRAAAGATPSAAAPALASASSRLLMAGSPLPSRYQQPDASSSSTLRSPPLGIQRQAIAPEPASPASDAGIEPSVSSSPESSGVTSVPADDYLSLLRNSTVVKFLGEIRTLYAMLSAVSRYPATPDYEDERTSAALTLISYLRRTHRRDMYTKYVTFLSDLHSTLGNTAEAALSYLLHADILDWSSTHLQHVRSGDRDLFPSQTSAARLESVLLKSINALSAAQCWEEASRLCEVLLRRYESVTAEYSKLADLLRIQASLFEDMARSPRVYPSYFVVVYKGRQFPKSIRGKTMIYRGGPSERIVDFEERLLQKWKGAVKVPLVMQASHTASASSVADRNRDSIKFGSPVGFRTGAASVTRAVTGDRDTYFNDAFGSSEADEDDDGESGCSDDDAVAVTPSDGIIAANNVSSTSNGGFGFEVSLASVTVLSPTAVAAMLQRLQSTDEDDVGGGGMSTDRTPLSPGLLSSPGPPRTPLPGRGNAAPSPVNSTLTLSLHSAANGTMRRLAATSGLLPTMQAKSVGDALHAEIQMEQLAAAGVKPVLLHVGTVSSSQFSTLAMDAAAAGAAGGAAASQSDPASSAADPGAAAAGGVASAASHVPQLIRQGRDQAGARHFQFQKPFRVRADKTNNEYLDLWIKRYVITTADAFPTTRRRSQVVSIQEVVLNPVEAAISGLQDKNSALRDLIERAAAGPDRCAEQSFTQALQGVVDAAVSGGVANYKPFFTGEFRTSHPEIAADLESTTATIAAASNNAGEGGFGGAQQSKAHLIEVLRCTLVEQLRIVARGIRVHATKCSAEMLPLHEFLCSRFDHLKTMVRAWGVGA